MIACGTAGGKLCALDLKGKVLWECATDDTFSRAITFLPRRNSTPLILFTGLWGNLHAVDVHGRHVWKHLFRAKVRGAPVVLDIDGHGHFGIFVPTFHQHVYQFDENGELKDDIRLEGILPSALAPIAGASNGQPDLLVTSTTLLAYRLRPGPPKSQYGLTAEPQNVRLSLDSEARRPSMFPGLVVQNPNGALINVQLSWRGKHGAKKIIGRITARSAFEIPVPDLGTAEQSSLRATARDRDGNLLDSLGAPAFVPASSKAQELAGTDAGAPRLLAWPTAPYSLFDETRLAPLPRELIPGKTGQVSVETMYLDEADQGAFIIASTGSESTEARVTVSRPIRKDGVAFGGTIVLREVLLTGSVNGEQVPDALPALDNAGLITLLPHRAAKIWVSVDTHGAERGNYVGKISVTPLLGQDNKIELPLNLEVLELRLPREFPLKLCTWDYVPNRWFPLRNKEVLDDMAQHGVNIFPRSTRRGRVRSFWQWRNRPDRPRRPRVGSTRTVDPAGPSARAGNSNWRGIV